MKPKKENYLVFIYIQLIVSLVGATATIKDNDLQHINLQEPSMNSTIISSKKIYDQISDCSDMLDCLRCNINGCLKCPKFIMKDTRECVDQCPARYSSQWSSNSDIMGQMCVPINFLTPFQTLIAGALFGAILCFLIITIGVIIIKRNQQKRIKKSAKHHLIDGDRYEREEFHRQLDDLRPYAQYFLLILNDTRKQIRKSYISGDTTASTKYYPVIRDLAKILILLNRPVELIDGQPNDWNRLIQWAERMLVQYKPQQQLIDFFQSPTSQSSSSLINVDDGRLMSKHTTFKSLFYSTPVVQHRKKIISATLPPKQKFGSNITIQSNYDEKSRPLDDESSLKNVSSYPCENIDTNSSLISLQEFVKSYQHNDSSKDEGRLSECYGDSFEHVKNYLSKGSLLVVEDELIEFKLGLRPQDEIITEL